MRLSDHDLGSSLLDHSNHTIRNVALPNSCESPFLCTLIPSDLTNAIIVFLSFVYHRS